LLKLAKQGDNYQNSCQRHPLLANIRPMYVRNHKHTKEFINSPTWHAIPHTLQAASQIPSHSHASLFYKTHHMKYCSVSNFVLSIKISVRFTQQSCLIIWDFRATKDGLYKFWALPALSFDAAFNTS